MGQIWGKKAKKALRYDEKSDSISSSKKSDSNSGSDSESIDTEEEERILKEKWAALKARKKSKKLSKKTYEEKALEIDPQMRKLNEIEKKKKSVQGKTSF